MLQLFLADRTENPDATSSLLVGAHNAVHEALIVDAVTEAELVADLMAHDRTATLEQVLLSIRIVDTVPLWVVPAKAESANAFSEASPAEAEVPVGARIQVLRREAEHRIRVGWPVLDQLVKDTFVAARAVLLATEVRTILDFFIQEVGWHLLLATALILSWDGSSSFDDLDSCNSCEERLCIHFVLSDLLLGEAVVADEQVDLVLVLRQPLDVAVALLVVAEALIGLTVGLQPIAS